MGRFFRARGALSLVTVADGIVTVLLLACAISHAEPNPLVAPGKARPLVVPRFFESNLGQAASGVAFFSRGASYDLFLDGNDAVVATHAWPESARSHHLTLRPLAPDRGARNEGIQPYAAKLNYLIGNDRSKWRTNVPVYGGVIRRGVWPGIDLIYHVAEDVEFDFVLAPRAQPRRVRFALDGAERAEIDAHGDLVVTVRGERLTLRKPFAFQSDACGRRPVAAHYILGSSNTGHGATVEVSLGLSAYDPSRPLTIDPVLSYSSYLGGANTDGLPGNGAYALAIDKQGNIYVAGLTFASDFSASADAFQTSKKGPANAANAFVAKFNPNLSGAASLIWATYLGGSGQGDAAYAIAVDGNGDAYTAGSTASPDFPTTTNAYDRTCGSDGACNDQCQRLPSPCPAPDAFVTELNADGDGLVYSTFLGGSNLDVARGIALDGSGHIFVAGATVSSEFPVSANAFQSSCVPCEPLTPSGASNAFVSELDPTAARSSSSTRPISAGAYQTGHPRWHWTRMATST